MFYRTAFWLMLPVSAAQGLWLRRQALRLPGASGPRQGAVGNGEPLRLLALGDSIIDGVGAGKIESALPVQFAKALAEHKRCCVHWQVEGQSGFDIEDVLECLQGLQLSALPDLVLISVGVNDVTGLSSTRHWRRKLIELLELLNLQWPGSRTVFAGLPPMALFPLPPQPLRFTLGLRAALMDRIAADVINGFENAEHVPTRINPTDHSFCEDGFHPSAESCSLWAKELASIDQRRFAS
ncbi:MAG: SGNH/GDSL hydrolase family protein [Xanthomonadales bacterium]|nr:SGNH/GDSL hydrolase family protein [Gammaproteobacteria bacterium]MBT8052860.1 SGNH/GDSL hydrolase family protein [Gammaproteobacteria bacterium]NND55679.1 SGNH/GDSL hydrolase family protein [Xanthomonadales bacterium]NNK49990.1 SGNH/GDSL hydrolase family protein [Xanthomonadales bacterium]